MKMISTIGFVFASSILLIVGCTDEEDVITWRSDVAPIHKRIAILAPCTNMLWHGEIINKNSFLSPPGPSAYRVCCIIPDASLSIQSITKIESDKDVIHDRIDFLPGEKAMLKSKFKVNPETDTGVLNEQLTKMLLKSPYWGQSIYFKTNDVLCIILFGE